MVQLLQHSSQTDNSILMAICHKVHVFWQQWGSVLLVISQSSGLKCVAGKTQAINFEGKCRVITRYGGEIKEEVLETTKFTSATLSVVVKLVKVLSIVALIFLGYSWANPI